MEHFEVTTNQIIVNFVPSCEILIPSLLFVGFCLFIGAKSACLLSLMQPCGVPVCFWHLAPSSVPYPVHPVMNTKKGLSAAAAAPFWSIFSQNYGAQYAVICPPYLKKHNGANPSLVVADGSSLPLVLCWPRHALRRRRLAKPQRGRGRTSNRAYDNNVDHWSLRTHIFFFCIMKLWHKFIPQK